MIGIVEVAALAASAAAVPPFARMAATCRRTRSSAMARKRSYSFFLGDRNYAHSLALSDDGGDFTYVETRALSNRIARRLVAAGLGIGHKFAAGHVDSRN